ncbi:MAG: hypothetical protein OEY85_08800 [Rhodospirillales bacterium]|nr:hypothetical protein [Rhodospirillales bacterium]
MLLEMWAHRKALLLAAVAPAAVLLANQYITSNFIRINPPSLNLITTHSYFIQLVFLPLIWANCSVSFHRVFLKGREKGLAAFGFRFGKQDGRTFIPIFLTHTFYAAFLTVITFTFAKFMIIDSLDNASKFLMGLTSIQSLKSIFFYRFIDLINWFLLFMFFIPYLYLYPKILLLLPLRAFGNGSVLLEMISNMRPMIMRMLLIIFVLWWLFLLPTALAFILFYDMMLHGAVDIAFKVAGTFIYLLTIMMITATLAVAYRRATALPQSKQATKP